MCKSRLRGGSIGHVAPTRAGSVYVGQADFRTGLLPVCVAQWAAWQGRDQYYYSLQLGSGLLSKPPQCGKWWWCQCCCCQLLNCASHTSIGGEAGQRTHYWLRLDGPGTDLGRIGPARICLDVLQFGGAVVAQWCCPLYLHTAGNLEIWGSIHFSLEKIM